MSLTVADCSTAHADWLHGLNERCVPDVNSLSAERLAEIVDMAAYARVALRGDAPLGVLIAFTQGSPYDSLNYRWFVEQGEPFGYIDRVMVAEEARGTGAGAALYADLEAWARGAGLPRLTCEINLIPPNPGSMAFHTRLGFEQIDTLENPAAGKTYAIMERRL